MHKNWADRQSPVSPRQTGFSRMRDPKVCHNCSPISRNPMTAYKLGRNEAFRRSSRRPAGMAPVAGFNALALPGKMCQGGNGSGTFPTVPAGASTLSACSSRITCRAVVGS